MALSVNAHPGVWLDGVAVAAQDLRLQQASAMLTGASPSGTTGIAARPGVRYGTGSPLLVAASSGMSVTVNAGVAFVQGTASATAGMYTVCLDTTSTITAATSDPTNPRIDNVTCQVTDVGTSSSTVVVTLQTGTPAPSPVAPTLPANSLLLATIAVGAGVSTIVSGNITDKRVYTAALGGVVTMANVTGGISGPAGTYADDLSTGRLKRSDGAGNARQPKVAAFAPASSSITTTVDSNPGVAASLGSVSITVDGQTEIEIKGSFPGLLQNTPTIGDWAVHYFQVDGAKVPGAYFYWSQTLTISDATGGGTFIAYITPAAGTHTVTWTLITTASSSHSVSAFNPGGSTNSAITFRVSATLS